ncbi:hypothetical protein ACJ5NV_13650 [Loktanella agnita]|uniref:hypothetical protein n=1 Tax=Loktanella agnita TaxID=287097 RepID=UPI003986D124
MALDAERIIDMAPAGQFGLVDRYLPDPYRRALSRHGDAMASLTRAARDTLRRSLSELEAVQRSRALEFFNDLSDGKLLGALHDQAPWPEDDTETFRIRLGRVAALAMRGAATADRLLALAALAGNGHALASGSIAQAVPPETDYRFVLTQKDAQGQIQSQTLQGRTDPGQTRQYFVKPTTGGLFPVDVIDAPLRRYDAEISPLPGDHYRFALDNPASENLAGLEDSDPLLWPDPTFSITAGAAPFGPFALVQTGQAQAIIVNRVLAPGATLDFSVRDMIWNHLETGSTSLSKLTCLGNKDALYAGFGLSADDHLIPAPNTDKPIGPLLTLRSKSDLNFTGAQSHGVPKDATALHTSPLQVPSFLGEGRSQWRILTLTAHDESDPDIHKAQFAPVPSTADITLSARWFGRRPGEFAVVMPDTALAADHGGPLSHRTIWRDQMIERFKLAGTVRIAKNLLFSADDVLQDITEMHFSDKLRPSDQMELNDPLYLTDSVHPSDSIEMLEQRDLSLASALTQTDRIELTASDAQVEPAISAAHPVDTMTFAAGFPPDLRATAKPTDSIEILPEIPIDARDSVRPQDTLTLTDAELRPDDLTSTGHPRDSMTLSAGLPDSLRSVAHPRDTIGLDPGAEIRSPTDTDPPLRTRAITLRSVVQPQDRITIRRLRNG